MRPLGSWRDIRLGIIMAVFALTIAALIGGQGLARTLRIDRPLARAIDSIEGVRDYSLVKTSNGSRLELTLGRVADLEQVVSAVVRAIDTRQREQVAEIAIRDCRRDLDRVYYELRFSLEEALATGLYTKLHADLAALARRARLDQARIYLGRQYLYVQLERGSAYLYQALPRPAAAQVAPLQGGGAR